MAKRLKVTAIERQLDGDRQQLRASFVCPAGEQEVWFRTNNEVINTSAEPFLPVALIPAMRRRWAVALEGEISAQLLQGAETVQRLLNSWYRKLRLVNIRIAGNRPLANSAVERPSAAFFSGGVDSFFTLLQHQDELTHLIFVHGFDLPLDAVKSRAHMADNARQVARQLNMELVEVETNLRDFGDPHVSWPDAYFGAGLAAVGLLLSPRFARIYIPASVSQEQLIPMGSHPDMDPHWGNGEVEFVHDGVASNRSAKIRAIAGTPLVNKHLRVCNQALVKGLNCGRCRKCLWTMMVLESLGKLEVVDAFPDGIDLDALRQHVPTDQHQQDRYRESVQHLEQRNANPELRKVLQDALAAQSGSRLPRFLPRLKRKALTWMHRDED